MDPLQGAISAFLNAVQGAQAAAEVTAAPQAALAAFLGQEVSLLFQGAGEAGLLFTLPSGQTVTAQGAFPYPEGTQVTARVTQLGDGLRLQTLRAQPPAPPAILAPLVQGEAQALQARLTQPSPPPELEPLVQLFRLLGGALPEASPAPLPAPPPSAQVPAAPPSAASAPSSAASAQPEAAAGSTTPSQAGQAAPPPAQAAAAPPGALPPAASQPGTPPPPAGAQPGAPPPPSAGAQPGAAPAAAVPQPGAEAAGTVPPSPAGAPPAPAAAGSAPATPASAEPGPIPGPPAATPATAPAPPAQPVNSAAQPVNSTAQPAGSAPQPGPVPGQAGPATPQTAAQPDLPGPVQPAAPAPAAPLQGETVEPLAPTLLAAVRLAHPPDAAALKAVLGDLPDADLKVLRAAATERGADPGLAQEVVARVQAAVARRPDLPAAAGDAVVHLVRTLLRPERGGAEPGAPAPGTAAPPAAPETWETWLKAGLRTLADPAASPREAPFHAAQAREGTAYFELPLPWSPQTPLQLWVESDRQGRGRDPREAGGTTRVLLGLSFTRLGETRLGLAKGPDGLRARVWAERPEPLRAAQDALEADLRGLGLPVDLKILALDPGPGGTVPSLRSLVTGSTLQILG